MYIDTGRAERGRQAEQQGRTEGGGYREAENPVIQTRFETSNGCPTGQGGDKNFGRPGRQAQSECATGSGQHQNFGEQLPKDALLRGAERQPDRYFTPPSLPPYN